jgi:hypothetical protein
MLRWRWISGLFRFGSPRLKGEEKNCDRNGQIVAGLSASNFRRRLVTGRASEFIPEIRLTIVLFERESVVV